MFPNLATTLPSVTTLWHSQFAYWNEFSSALTKTFLNAWESNLRLGEAMLHGTGMPIPGAVAAAPFAPREALDRVEAYRQGLADFATSMQDDMICFAAGRAPAPAAPTPATGAVSSGAPDSDAPTPGEDAARATADEKWRAAEQAYFDSAAEKMQAEGQALTGAADAEAGKPPAAPPDGGATRAS